MKNLIKFFGIIALAAVIGFSMTGCQNGTTSGGPIMPIIAVTGPPTITTATLLNGTVGTAYSQTLMAAGDTPITWSLDTSALPSGLTLLGSGTISGTPTTAGTSIFTVKAVNAAGSDTKQLSITIAAGSTTPTYSLNGIWEMSGWQITVSGSTGVFSVFPSLDGVWLSAKNKNYISIGSQKWRNITSTGTLTWSGQSMIITYNTSSPNVAIGTEWHNCTFTMSANGQTITLATTDSSGSVSQTWTRVSTYSLDGVWEMSGWQITVSGSTGVFSVFPSLDGVWLSAKNKNYISIGSQKWRNITSTGTLTWSGQSMIITYNTSSPNVATGTEWHNCTFTMSANGQTITLATTDSSGSVSQTWTRKQ